MRTPIRAARFSTALISAALLWGGAARADNTVVLELYTSQGCSSCPSADAILRDLSGQDGIIALSMNVDYWDYLGWKDDLALPGNTKRQRKYARRLNSRHVYTPQLMVDGRMHVVGSRRSQVDTMVSNYLRQPDTAEVSARRSGDTIQISVSGNLKLPEDAMVWIVGFDSSVTKAIGGGENHGRSVEYRNVVREWRKAGQWDGRSPLTLTSVKPAGSSGCAVIVQQGEVGPILGATKVSY